MKFVCRFSAVILLCCFIACNQGSKQRAPANAVAATEDEHIAVADSAAPLQNQVPVSQQAVSTEWDKKIIRNANLTIEVKDYSKYSQQLNATVGKSGGYIAQSEQNRSDYKIENVVTIKVPVQEFTNAVNQLVAGNENIITQKITSQDVTGEVFDTRARLEAKKQVRTQYMELLKQAKKMEDVIQVQKEINNIQVELDAAASKINYMTHAAAMSTIELTYFQILNATANDNVKPSFGVRVLNALTGGMEWIGELLVILLSLWPLWVLLVGVWFGYKKFKSSKVKTN